jgi:hypothetical protein
MIAIIDGEIIFSRFMIYEWNAGRWVKIKIQIFLNYFIEWRYKSKKLSSATKINSIEFKLKTIVLIDSGEQKLRNQTHAAVERRLFI